MTASLIYDLAPIGSTSHGPTAHRARPSVSRKSWRLGRPATAAAA